MEQRLDNPTSHTVIMGIGNLLLGDDGVGVHAARALIQTGLPAGIAVLDVGMSFLETLEAIDCAQRIIVLDAMMAGGEPGAIYRSTLHQCECPARIDSLHNFDIFRLLALAQNINPIEVVVFGVEPDKITWSLELSPKVSACLPSLLAAVYDELGLENFPVLTGNYPLF